MGNLLRRLLRWLSGRPDKVMYIGGSDTLPPPLPRQEEAEWISRLEQGELLARQTLIERNLRLVVYIARRFENTGINIEDLISIGTIGLIKGISSFDPEKGARLATHAAPSGRTRTSNWPPTPPGASKTRFSCTCGKTPVSGRR